ncbi:hypothetical protein H0H93_012399, partial [Arthromyces matolae]
QLLKYPSAIWLKFVERDQPAGTSYALKRGTGSMVSREQRDDALRLHGACDRCVAKNCGHLCFYPGGALPCFRCGVDAAKCCFNGKGTRSSKGIGKGLAANIINAAKTTTTSATLPKASASVPPVAKAKRTGGTSKLVRPATSSPVATLSKPAPSRLSVPTQTRSTASLPGPSKSSSSAYKPLPAISFSKTSTSTPYVRPTPRPLTRSNSQVFVEVPPRVRPRHFISKPTVSSDDKQDDAPPARLHKRPLETSTEKADDDADTPRPIVKKVRRESPERSASPIDTFESQTQPTPPSSPDLSDVDSEREIVIPEPPQATPPEFRKIDLTADKSDDDMSDDTRGKTDKDLDKDDAETVGKMILDDDFPADYVLPSRFLDLEAQENNKGESPVSSEEDDIETITSPLLAVIPPPTVNESDMEAFYGNRLLQLSYFHSVSSLFPFG